MVHPVLLMTACRRADMLGFNTDTVELTVKTLLRHLITRECKSPTNSVRTPYVCVEP